MKYFVGYKCSGCGREIPAGSVAGECPECSRPLLAVYDMDLLKKRFSREDFFEGKRGEGVWRFWPLLPDFGARVSLGEGDTPLLRSSGISSEIGIENLFIKDESINPAGSFKARGMAVAVSRLVGLGVKEAWLPSAGNAALALSAYCARSGIKCNVFMPRTACEGLPEECSMYGANTVLVDGLLPEAAARMYDEIEEGSLGILTTFREPGRVEGKKTMAFEIEREISCDWIIFPTGGGTGIVAIWKAYREMEMLGWLRESSPRLVLVQAGGCAPLVRAFERGDVRAERWENPETVAHGINVPFSRADFLVLSAIYESGGLAVSVTDEEILSAMRRATAAEGVFFSPEGAATVAALEKMVRAGRIGGSERVVVFNTASGVRYRSLLGGIESDSM